MKRPARRLLSLAAFCCLLSAAVPLAAADFVGDLIRGFADSEIVFSRSTSNVPFIPLAYANFSLYSDTRVRRPDESSLEYDLATVSQGALLPLLVSPRDALLVGEWTAVSRFDAADAGADSFNAMSAGLAVGWLRQIDDHRQFGTFVMPLAHRADLENSAWSYEALGGAFGRHERDERLWWVYGFYFDVGPGEDIYLPYLGASWEFDDELTLSAILPWPAILYAPDNDTLWRFGAAPSGASWTLDSEQNEISFSLDNWQLGLTAEHRVSGNFWLAFEAGVAGLRSLRLEDGEWRSAKFDVDESAYLRIAFNFRPELPR